MITLLARAALRFSKRAAHQEACAVFGEGRRVGGHVVLMAFRVGDVDAAPPSSPWP